MYRRDVLGISIAAAMVLLPAGALAQQQRQQPAAAPQQAQRPLKDMLVGAWTLLLVDGVKADGTQAPLYGPNPIGSVIYTPNGRYSVQIMRTVNRPPFKSNNRDTGTADENKATVQGTLSYFGTYTVEEAGKSISLRIEGSSFPNAEGGTQRLQVSSVTDDELTITLPGTASSTPGAGYPSLQVIFRKVK
jgi:Lipocalin-like domain